MNDSYVRLQRTLRAIERGERLESIDELLLREVLQQPPPRPTPATSRSSSHQDAPRGSDAYRVLVQLRRQRQKAREHEATRTTTIAEAVSDHGRKPSPEKKMPMMTTALTRSPTKALRPHLDEIDNEWQQQQREERESQQRVEMHRQEMAAALAETQRRLQASHHDVERASRDMDALLSVSQSVLSSSFLFERNLTEFCQQRSIDVIQRVLQRFRHRYYALYYQKWVEATRQLRREQQRRAVATIVRVVRGHNARTLRRRLQREAQKVETQARQVLHLRMNYRHHQAVKIQRVWHRYQWTHHERSRQQRKRAVIYLQRQWRDRKLRRNALIAVLLNVKQVVAAIRIQTLVRGHLTRRRITRQRRETARQAIALQMLTRNTSREAMLQWQIERHGAAFVITQALYPMVLRQRFRRLAKQLKRQQASRLIAANVWTWYSSSERYQRRQQASVAERLKELVRHEQARLFAASVQIQKTIRRWWYQQRYEMMLRRHKKLARHARIQKKQERLEGNRGTWTATAAALAKASAGLADVLKHARKKPPRNVDTLAAAASAIQRAFRRYRHHRHFMFQQWRRRALDVERKVIRRRHAAVAIQRHVRGRLARRVVRELRAKRSLKRWIVRWKWKRTLRRAFAARRILRWLHHMRTRRLAALWKRQTARQCMMAVRLQRWLRHAFFYRKRTAKFLAFHRRREEALVFARQCLVVSTQHFTDELILLSATGSSFNESIRLFVKGLSAPAKLLQKPPARARFPILPLVFLAICGLKDTAKWSSMEMKDLLSAKLERSKMVTLFKAANKAAGSATSPQRRHAKEAFSTTDVDVAMAKAAGASKSALMFSEFIATIQRLADMKLVHITLWWNKYDGAEARLLALLWQSLFPIADLQPLVHDMALYVDRVVHAHARVVQRLFLRQRDRARGLLIKLQRLQQREMEKRKAAIIRVQASVRRLLARKLYRSRVQAQYEKFIDPEWDLPYWMNPMTGFSTWQKPWVLGDVDVQAEVVPFPPPDKILTVACQGKSDCATCSDVYCFLCDEFFCHDCEPIYHKTKSGEDHEMESLRKCGLCKFQIASRHCADCAGAARKRTKSKATRPTHGETSDQAEEQLRDPDALYCDVCFAFTHRRGALQVHASTPLVEMCGDCQEDDAVLDSPTAPLTVKPLPRAVQWECRTDKKRVCASCAWSLYPVEACGELIKLPIVTNQMKAHTERLRKEQEQRERFDTELIRARELLVQQTRAAAKIERFWRNSAPLIRARRVARALRGEREATWRQHQQDAVVKKTVKYQVKNALGLAPPPPSDSVTQRKLREMNAIQRRQLGIRARAFGLLLSEYMQLGVPLPGVARLTVGTKFIACSEDLRGWIRNRQTLRLKKLPSKAERERARQIRSRHAREPPPLEDKVWLHDLEVWMRDPADSVLVDVDATQRVTEHNIPLATAFLGHNDKAEDTDDPLEYAMFLVEFSMDPERIVWVSHSLAERFAVWTKQKMHAYREKRKLHANTPEATIKSADSVQSVSATMDQAKEADEVALNTESTQNQAEVAPQAGGTAWGEQVGYAYDYSNYYAWNAWSTATPSGWYDNNYGYSSALIPLNDPAPYNDYSSTAAAPYGASGDGYAPTDTSLVPSTNYFYSDDGNAAVWQAYYAAHPEMASSYDYANQSQQQQSDPFASAGYPTQAAWGSADSSGYGAAPGNATTTNAAYYTPQEASSTKWEEVFDPTTQQTYYYNRETQETSWTYPS